LNVPVHAFTDHLEWCLVSPVPADPFGASPDAGTAACGAPETAGDVPSDQIDELFAADFIQHSPYAPPGGRDSLKQWWAGQIAVIPDLTTTVEQILGSGDKVAVFRTVRGTIKNDIPAYGIKASGQQLMLRASDIFRVENGKIAEHWEVTDTGPLLQLAGR